MINFIKKVWIHLQIFYNNKIGIHLWKKPTIKSIDETIDYICDNHCSVSRFGDGEFAEMCGHGYDGFQAYDAGLGNRLNEVLTISV